MDAQRQIKAVTYIATEQLGLELQLDLLQGPVVFHLHQVVDGSGECTPAPCDHCSTTLEVVDHLHQRLVFGVERAQLALRQEGRPADGQAGQLSLAHLVYGLPSLDDGPALLHQLIHLRFVVGDDARRGGEDLEY